MLLYHVLGNNLCSVGFKVFTAVVMKSIIFWDMTPCHTPFIFGCSLTGGDGFLLSQDQPMGTDLQSLPNPGSLYMPVFRLTKHSTCHMRARWFAGLFFDPEDGGAMFLRNVGYYTASYPRRLYSSIYVVFT
jgi:hypothetical protein